MMDVMREQTRHTQQFFSKSVAGKELQNEEDRDDSFHTVNIQRKGTFCT
jgi:hypothetical protein